MKHRFDSALSPEEILERLRTRTIRGAWKIEAMGPITYRTSFFGKRRFYLAMSPYPIWGGGSLGRINTCVFRGKLAPKEDGTAVLRGSFGAPIWLMVFWWGCMLFMGIACLQAMIRAQLHPMMYIPFGIVVMGVAGMGAIGIYCLGHFYGGEWEADILSFIRRELLCERNF